MGELLLPGGHLFELLLKDVKVDGQNLVDDQGINAAAVAPDGRAYVAVSGPACLRAPGSQPLRVYIQNGGSTLR